MNSAIKFAFDIFAFTPVMVLIVLGLGVIAGMMGTFNFAHDELVLLGAYTVYFSDENGLGTWPGTIAAPVVVGLVLERTIIRRFYANPIIAMLGMFSCALYLMASTPALTIHQFPLRTVDGWILFMIRHSAVRRGRLV